MIIINFCFVLVEGRNETGILTFYVPSDLAVCVFDFFFVSLLVWLLSAGPEKTVEVE